MAPVRASCAYPGMFLPVNIDGRLLVDGLLGHAVPSMPLREMAPTRYFRVPGRALAEATRSRHVFDMIGQCFSIAQDRMCGPWKAASDLVLEPEIGEFAYDDFIRAPELIRAERPLLRAALPQIKSWFAAPAPQAEVKQSATTVPALAK